MLLFIYPFIKNAIIDYRIQKHPSRGVLRRRCSENMQQIYSRTSMPKCHFNKAAKQLCWNHTSAWVSYCKFAAYFQKNFLTEHLRKTGFENCIYNPVKYLWEVFLLKLSYLLGHLKSKSGYNTVNPFKVLALANCFWKKSMIDIWQNRL